MLFNFVIFLSFLSCTWATDKTLVPETKGEDVVCAVINKIENSLIFTGDHKMLRRIAYVESKFGEDRNTYRKGYHGGIWQIDEIGFNDAVQSGSHPNLDKLWSKIEILLGKQRKNIEWEDLRKPLFSGTFARIRLYLVKAPIPNKLDEQSQYWKINYNSIMGKGTVDDFIQRVNVMDKKFGSDCNMCQGRMNLAIVMDASGSIGDSNYAYAKQTARNLIDTFSNKETDIGYVMFSRSVEVIFPLKSNLTRDEMKTKINDSRYEAEGTQTNRGIDEGVEMLGNADNHTGVPKVMVIFTDGNPDSNCDTRMAAERAKKFNITIFAIGIGDSIDQNNLKEMASQDSFVIPVSSYQDLIQFTDKINSRTCSVPQTPDIGTKVKNDVLSKYEKRYFKFELPREGMTIKMDESMGKIKGYYSYTIENPSSAINDGEFTTDVFIAPLKFDHRKVKRDVKSANSVYVTMEGQEDNNVYSLDAIEGNHTNGGNQLKTSIICIITISMLVVINVQFNVR